uniref:Morn repeat protein 1 n=1 Tax=Tetraselmis sp. GSL018 TaxID=582737 RepID=A0A061S7W1_9CHLO|mmetsp:Transcript_27414/g.64938  ORF Transcript_27414/g.64938 Transcript_27414/m.64938 type:complete len:431 (-) Transcript_27414:192-1484(-)
MSDPNKEQPLMKEVGRGLQAPLYSPDDPQWHLAGSNHPYTPFPGNALKWESLIYDDGTAYEGLMRENIPHMKGTLIIGNGTGGGFQTPNPGDIYEGEFEAGYAHGLGQYIGAKGELYRGEFKKGQRNGCGVLVNMRPYLRRIQKGDSPEEAWEATREKIETTAKKGTWQNDLFLTGPSEDASFCHIHEINGVLEELQSVVARTRMFRHKPDGEVTIKQNFRDARGIPIPTMQDPLHYPHGTGFLAPGPMGQTFAVPDDPKLKDAMEKAARNHIRIYNMYNVPRDAPPGSVMERAEELGREEEERRAKAIAEMEAAERRRLRRLERLKAAEQRESEPKKEAAAEKEGKAEDGEDDAGDDVDDEDLTVASAGAVPPRPGPMGRPGFGGPTAFASISLGMSRAGQTISSTLMRAAVRAPRRPRLARPSDMQRQ